MHPTKLRAMAEPLVVTDGCNQLLHGHRFREAVGVLLGRELKSVDEDVGIRSDARYGTEPGQAKKWAYRS